MITNVRAKQAHPLGDNYCDYLCDYMIGDVLHTIWLSMSGVAVDIRNWSEEKVIRFYTETFAKIGDSFITSALVNSTPYHGFLVKLTPGIKGELSNNKQCYDNYPRMIFLSKAVEVWK